MARGGRLRIRGSEYLTLRYAMEDPRQFDITYQKLRDRLLAEGGVTQVTVGRINCRERAMRGV